MKIKKCVLLLLLTLAFSAHVDARTVIQNKGSDTLVNVAQAWAEAYQKINPDVSVAISGGGTGTGIAALINGTVDIANASRAMEPKELEAAKANGRNPVQHIVGHDALAIFLHKDNPLASVSIAQLQSMYGREGKAAKWTDLGVEVPGCKGQKIILVSRQNNSGTYLYFREAVLGDKGRYKMGTLDMNGSKDVIDLVEKTPCAIGYSGMAYATPNVKMMCLSKTEGVACVQPTIPNTLNASYPIARPLFMYTDGEPTGEIKTYLDWILSDAGQCIISKIGYAPVREIQCQ